MAKNNVRIKLKAYEHRSLDAATEKIVKSGRITPTTAKRLVIHKIATGEIDLDKTDKYLDIVKGQNGENIIKQKKSLMLMQYRRY